MSRLVDMLERMQSGTHNGATVQGNDVYGWRMVCDCGTTFNAYRHPVERDQFESPQWYAHVHTMRGTTPPIPNSDGLESPQREGSA